jgi:hypothetical protein
LLTAQSRTDQLSGNILSIVSSSLFEPYAVEDPEMFLSSIESSIQTVRFDAEGDEVAGVSKVRDLEKLKKALAKDINLSAPPEKFEGGEIWRSKDGEIAVAIVESRVVFGEKNAVEKCLAARNAGQNLVTSSVLQPLLTSSKAPVITIWFDNETAAKIAGALGGAKEKIEPISEPYSTETTFTSKGIERRTVSNAGLIGSIIEQFAKEQ